MKREKIPALIILVVLVGLVTVFYLFKPHPIIEDVDNNIRITIFYNPYYDQEADEQKYHKIPVDWVMLVDDRYNEVPDDNALVANYDDRDILDCLSRYNEYLTLSRHNGFMIQEVELEIFIKNMDDLDEPQRIIILGNTSYRFGSSGDPKYKIQDADKLRAELLDLIDIKGIIEAPDHEND